MERLACLYLDLCENVKNITDSIRNLKSLEHLHLSGTAIQELPSSIENLKCLKDLKLHGCKNNIYSIMNLSSSNCFKLDQNAWTEIIRDEASSIQLMRSKLCGYEDEVRILYPGSEIPEIFKDQKLGSSTDKSPYQYREMFHALSTGLRQEGPRALYKGRLPSVIGVV
ncbi:disease resistance protein RPS6-like isoform X4 [Euphorbia lathyris]|uniref:disease resistance protein RPS6-like isoform X4 n=1 Tax=Euphorbia lathyris TaxID=212925 RepID=UPI00331447AE